MYINLPYGVGKRFKTVSSGKECIDTLDHYEVRDQVYVVLDIGGRLSMPIPVSEFVQKWSPIENEENIEDGVDENE